MDTNVTGTLVLLEEAVAAGVGAFVHTSTTSAFGRALTPAPASRRPGSPRTSSRGRGTSTGPPRSPPRTCASSSARDHGLPCLVLRTSRFFPEPDDERARAAGYADDNVKVNELLYRRDRPGRRRRRARGRPERAPRIGFGRYVVSATTPFTPGDLAELRRDAPAVVERLVPDYPEVYERLGWRMFPRIDRVYVNARARADLGWEPRYDFRHALDLLRNGQEPRSALATSVGAKGYHPESTGPYTTR